MQGEMRFVEQVLLTSTSVVDHGPDAALNADEELLTDSVSVSTTNVWAYDDTLQFMTVQILFVQ